MNTVCRVAIAGCVVIESLFAVSRVEDAGSVLKQCSPTNGSVVATSCVRDKRIKTNGCVLVGRVVLERLSSKRRILDASREAKERLGTNSRIVGTRGQAEKGSRSSLSRISAKIAPVRRRAYGLAL